MPDTIEMPRKLRVTVTVEEFDSTKPIETAKSKDLWGNVEASIAKQVVNFCVECAQYLFSRLLRLLTGQ